MTEFPYKMARIACDDMDALFADKKRKGMFGIPVYYAVYGDRIRVWPMPDGSPPSILAMGQKMDEGAGCLLLSD